MTKPLCGSSGGMDMYLERLRLAGSCALVRLPRRRERGFLGKKLQSATQLAVFREEWVESLVVESIHCSEWTSEDRRKDEEGEDREASVKWWSMRDLRQNIDHRTSEHPTSKVR